MILAKALGGHSSEKMAPPQPTKVEDYASRAKAMLEAQDYAGAMRESSSALENSGLAEVALMRARALFHPLVDQATAQKHVTEGTAPQRSNFEEAYVAFQFALMMDKDNEEAARECQRLLQLRRRGQLLRGLGRR